MCRRACIYPYIHVYIAVPSVLGHLNLIAVIRMLAYACVHIHSGNT